MNQSPLQLLRHWLALLYKYKVVEVFANPQTHRRELLFLLGIFFIILTIIICLLLLVYFQVKTPPKIAPITKADFARRRRRRLFKAAVPALAIFIALGFGSYRSTQTEFCERCHVMKPTIISWKKSTHNKTPCLACHMKSGATGYLSAQFKGLDYAITFLKNRVPKRLTSEVDSSNCMSCHSSLRKKTVTSKSVRISHKELIAAGYRCVDCHTNTGHAKPAVTPRYSGMSACLPCHDGKKASNNCKICHANEVGVAMRKLEYFGKVSFDESLFSNCRRCHVNEDKCIKCHGVELPHPAGWAPEAKDLPPEENGPILHAKAAAFEKKKLCWKCHTESNCSDCHGLSGHSPSWKQGHHSSSEAVSNPANLERSCMSCHNKVTQFCVLCHEKR